MHKQCRISSTYMTAWTAQCFRARLSQLNARIAHYSKQSSSVTTSLSPYMYSPDSSLLRTLRLYYSLIHQSRQRTDLCITVNADQKGRSLFQKKMKRGLGKFLFCVSIKKGMCKLFYLLWGKQIMAKERGGENLGNMIFFADRQQFDSQEFHTVLETQLSRPFSKNNRALTFQRHTKNIRLSTIPGQQGVFFLLLTQKGFPEKRAQKSVSLRHLWFSPQGKKQIKFSTRCSCSFVYICK